MSNKPRLNGCDYLMLGFDYELRKRGFAGNSCQILLELGDAISAEMLQARLNQLWKHFPQLNARPGGWFTPHWTNSANSPQTPRVRIHRDTPGLTQRIFNEPLDTKTGHQTRFDLIVRENGQMNLVFTWSHALMDAPAAEHFLALVGREDLPLPKNSSSLQAAKPSPLKARYKLAWKYLHQLDHLCKAAPRTLGLRFPKAKPELHFRFEVFSPEETALIKSNGVRYCGVLSDAQYHVAIATMELHELHQGLGHTTPSYVIPLPVGLRPKGSVEPLFSNQVGMLMLQFLPQHLGSIRDTVAELKSQFTQGMRAGLLESGRNLGELFRFLPLPIYMTILKQGLRGEIGSLFYGDTAAVSPHLTKFIGAPIQNFAHVAAVTPSPGVGVIFYYFHGQLRITVLNLTTVLSDDEANEFAKRLRARLLNP